MAQIRIADELIEYKVRISTRARRAQLQLDPSAGLEVVLPSRLAHTNPESVLLHHKSWVLAHMQGHRDQRQLADSFALEIGGRVPYLGKGLPIHLGRPELKRAAAKLIKDEDGSARAIELDGITDDFPVAEQRRLIVSLLKKEARRFLEPLCHQWAVAVERPCKKVSIRAQKTRWGSCSSAASISLNWRLIMAPPLVAESIVVHEAVHLRHMNHSERFYALLQRLFPRYEETEAWLKRNGETLRMI